MTEQPAEPTPEPPADDLPDDDEISPRAREALRKARGLRTRLRTTESELEAAVTRLAASQRRDIERETAAILIDPSDVWRVPAEDQQAFVHEQFADIVPDAVRDAARASAKDKPHLARPPSAPPPGDRPIEGLRSGGPVREPTPPVSWQSVIGRG